jgi:Zn-dependent protease
MLPGNVENTMLDGTVVSRLRADIKDLFMVANIEVPRQADPTATGPTSGLGRYLRGRNNSGPSQGTVIFVGDLLQQDSEAVYDLIAERWRHHDYTPILRRYKGQIALIAQPGVIAPQPSNPWINFWLAVATVFSVSFTGAIYVCQCVPTTINEWLSGTPMMLAVMVILAAHEFGHYFAARYHKVAVTLPYFIPLPVTLVGTMGAVIQLRSPFKTKKQLFDIGVAGPLAGLIFAIPLILWAVAQSPVQPITREAGSALEGNSIFYLLTKYITHGQLLPHFEAYSNLRFWQEFALLLGGVIPAGGGVDIFIDSVALAAWFGLIVTALNLLPVGQLDGGHVIYCLLGDKAKQLGMAIIIVMLFAGIFVWTGWLIWAFITFFLIGPGHPPPLNDLVDLDPIRKSLAYAMIVIFIILFMPSPFQAL